MTTKAMLISQVHPPEWFGLNEDTLYTLEALAYWQQFTPEEFIRQLYHDLVNKQGVVLGFMTVLRDDPEFSQTPLSSTHTVGDACDAIIHSTEQTLSYLEVARQILLEMARQNMELKLESPRQPSD